MNFQTLQSNLLFQIRRRVLNGELTERGLARMSGLSQPHVHHVLKGVRSLSVASADRILRSLGLSVLDLVETTPEENALRRL
jgi:transcriptional regulator with XRE-family HTH domain